jgi:hypothetical protein
MRPVRDPAAGDGSGDPAVRSRRGREEECESSGGLNMGVGLVCSESKQ